MKLTSTRTRLTLGNVAAMAIVLIVVGVVLRYALEVRLMAEMDSRIRSMGHFIADARGDDGPPPPRDREPQDQGPNRQWDRPPGDQNPGPPPPNNGDTRSAQQADAQPGQPGPQAGQGSEWRRPEGPIDFRRFRSRPRLRPGRRLGDEMPPIIVDHDGKSVMGPDGKPVIDPQGYKDALNGREAIRTVTSEGVLCRVFSTPLRDHGHVIGVVQIPRKLTLINGQLRHLTLTLFVISPFALLLAGLCGAYLTGQALRPVREFAAAADRISRDNLGARLPVSGGDEFASLASTFNGTLERLQEAFERLEDSLDQQRRLTADASHELRTPLTVIKAHTSLSLSSPRQPEDYVKTLTAVDRAADTMGRIVQDLLLLARADAGQLTVQHEPVAVSEAIGEAIDSVEALEGPEVQYIPGDTSLRAPGDLHLLARVFTNILTNAKRHTPVNGEIAVHVARAGEQVVVTIADSGEGIPADHLARIGERFYRVDTARARTKGGTGLGLAICRTIVEAHGGTLKVDSIEGKGTTVSVSLPVA
ncbi:MAG TPA: ATP-binding protein [Capsulimonadaceae bacterium]|jgi:heavy metal sensor kinase